MARHFKMETDKILPEFAAELAQFIDSANAPTFGVDTEGRVSE